MNGELLIAHFNRISDAPDAVPRLRRFVLDLAVRGKLVGQEGGPGAAPIKGAPPGKLSDRRGTAAAEIESQWPHEVPDAWMWRRLATLSTQITDGEHATPPRISEHQVPLVTAKNVRDGSMDYGTTDWVSMETAAKAWNRCRPSVGDVLLVCVGATTGRLCVLREARDMVLVRSVALIRPTTAIDVYFLALVLRSPMAQKQIWEKVKVAAQPCLYINRIASLAVPLPPVAEQHRIVAKVDELMALCDRLEAVQREREISRVRLTAATHHHLNNGANADEFRSHAQFFIGHLPRLTAGPDQIKQLRETILSLAVRGQLVPQIPNSESAIELISQIRREKNDLLKSGILRRAEPSEVLAESAFPFPMPPSWVGSSLRSVCLSITDGDHLPPPKADKGVPFLVIGNVRDQTIRFENSRHVAEEYYAALDPIRRPQSGDILYTLVGSYGIPVHVRDNRPFCVQRHIGILRPSKYIDRKFLGRVLESGFVFDQATHCATGIAQKTVPLAGLRKIRIPLPPIAEQRRIAAKVDELMTLCDQMEAKLTTARAESSRLLESVLHHALNAPTPSQIFV